MQILNYDRLRQPDQTGYFLQDAPVRVLQFGEGNFLRAFADFFIDVANETCGFNSKVLLVQPIAEGLSEIINRQEGLYTLYLRGIESGKEVERKRIISCVDRCLNPYTEYAEFLQAAHNPDLQFIISNTTEAGIAFDAACCFADTPPASYPAKLTRFLFERFTAFHGKAEKGLVILPCELIDDNGKALEACVHSYIGLWQLSDVFSAWVKESVHFCPTLVDRIVTGYPRAQAEELNAANGYQDQLLDTAELFGLWVIEGPDFLKEELPFAAAGLPVQITNDHKPYKERKVRILNGAHTTMALAAFLAGKEIVRECMEDSVIDSFLHKVMFEEIIPTLTLPKEALQAFAEAVLERFQNPYIDHALLSISLNSVSKWKARVLPSVKGYLEKEGAVPGCLCFGFAALLQFYCGTHIENGKLIAARGSESYAVTDDLPVLEFFAAHHADSPADYVRAVCGNQNFWDMDLNSLPGFAQAVAAQLEAIRNSGILNTMQTLL